MANKEWHIGDTVTNEGIADAAEWCNANNAYPKQTSYDPATGAETWVITAVPQPTLEEVKAEKNEENNAKAEVARESQTFTVTLNDTVLSFISDRKTQQDLQTALTFLQAGATKYTWIDEQGTSFDFTTTAQVLQVSEVFMEKANVYPKWAYFKNLIDSATTLAEVQAIVIDYDIELEAETTDTVTEALED